MTKKEAKKIALEAMMKSVGTAYYKISDSNNYYDDEKDLLLLQLNRLGERIARCLKTTYTTY